MLLLRMKTFSRGLSLSKFLLWITTHGLLVVCTKPSWGTNVLQKDVVRGLCQAQCVSLGSYFQSNLDIKCLGPPGHSVIPRNTTWLVNCTADDNERDFVDCVGTCSLIQFRNKGYIPAKPEVSMFLDIRSKNISMEWQPDTMMSPKTVYVISMHGYFSPPSHWKQVAIVRGGYYTIGPIEDICALPSFRVAAVNRFGSRWFSKATKVPGNIPGRPQDLRLKSITYGKDTKEALFVIQWRPPFGWDIKDVRVRHVVDVDVHCSAPDLDGVMVVMDHRPMAATNQVEGDYFTYGGRASLNAIGCTIVFKISSVSRCNSRWIGPAQEFRLSLKCSDIMEYDGEYCTNPPVLVPGPVTKLKLTLIPLVQGIIGLVSWQPPIDTGSAGKVVAYHLFYGIVDMGSKQIIKQFEGIPQHKTVSGNTCSVDIFINITTLDSYKTIGVMVRAAGPGQIIESPFGSIIYADNKDSLLQPKASHMIYDDDSVIVIASTDSQTEDRDTGIGVEIFWRRPDEETQLDILKYALEWGRLHSNDTSALDDGDDDLFDTTTVSEMFTNGSENFISLGYLLPVSTYGLKILPLLEPIDDVPREFWENQTLHIFNTPFLTVEDESTPRNVVTVPVNLITQGNSQERTWIIVAAVMTTAVLLCLSGFLIYKRWHQRRIKCTPDVTPEQRYRHYSQYGPGQSLGATEERSGPRRVVDEWELPVSSVKTGPLLGSGAFGKVVKGRVSRAVLEHRTAVTSMVQGGEVCLDQADKCHVTVAIKMLHDHCELQHKQDFLKEIDLMKRIGHNRNVVSMLGCCTMKDPIYLVVEHMANGDLLDYLKNLRHRLTRTSTLPDHYKNSKQGLHTATDLLNFASQIVLGMDFLASKGYVHRDLAARNILVDSTRQCKIGDFGLTRYMYNDEIYINRKGGRLPLKWMSIEAIFDQSFSTASDVWSFGIVLFEITTLGGTPYPTIPYRDLLKELQAGYRMERPDNCSQEVYRMMLRCWTRDPKLRPSFKELSDWFQDLLSDTSGVGYIDMGVNLDRDVYQVEDKPEEDCLRYPLHRTIPGKTILGGGGRLVASSVTTSDDSGYTKSSVSSGESGTVTPCLGRRREMQEGGRGSESIVQNNTGPGDRVMHNRSELLDVEDEHKSKVVRKRVGFIDVNELIEDDDEVFRDDASEDLSLCPRRRRGNSAEELDTRDENVNISNVSKARLSDGKNILEPEMKRTHSDSNLLKAGHNDKRCGTKFCLSRNPKFRYGMFKNVSELDLTSLCYDDVCVTGILDSLHSEKRQMLPKIKTRKRKMAVVTAPTLALNNDLYFHLDTTRFKQRPPAIKIRRRIQSNTPYSPRIDKTNLHDSSHYGCGILGKETCETNKPCSFEYSIEAEVHSPESRDTQETISRIYSSSSGDSTGIEMPSFLKDDSQLYRFSWFTGIHGEKACSSQRSVMGANESSSPDATSKHFEDIRGQNVADVLNAEQREIMNSSTDTRNASVVHTPKRERILEGLNRIRNDSGIPRSPDDFSWSPGSDSRFFPDGSELDENLVVVRTEGGDSFFYLRLDSPVPDSPSLDQDGVPESPHHADQTLLSSTMEPHGSKEPHTRDCTGAGVEPRCECPAQVSEKHPYALHNIKAKKALTDKSVSSGI